MKRFTRFFQPVRVCFLFLFAVLVMWRPAPGAVLPAIQEGQAEAAKAAPVWLDAQGNPLPFQSEEKIIDFLKTAKVVSMDDTEQGVTRPRRVLLEKDGVRAHGVFRDVAIFQRQMQLADGLRFNFRDDAIFECAAYELGRMLGLTNIPPATARKIQGKKGTVQIWLENSMVELNRVRNQQQPPDVLRWNRQYEIMRVFDSLIYNEDRNQGNILIDKDWNIWMIDHTRSFRTYDELWKPETIKMCERNLFEKIKALDENEVKQRLKPFLRSFEINGLLKRRVKLIELIEKLIAEKGEGQVLFTLG